MATKNLMIEVFWMRKLRRRPRRRRRITSWLCLIFNLVLIRAFSHEFLLAKPPLMHGKP